MAWREKTLLALFLASFPLSWPALRLRNLWGLLRFDRARSRARPGALEEVRPEDVRVAHLHVRESYTFASGTEEDGRVIELVLRDGRRVSAAENVSSLEPALRAAGVPTHEHVARASGAAAAFGWGLWAASSAAMVAVARALATGSTPAIVIAVLACTLYARLLVGALRVLWT